MPEQQKVLGACRNEWWVRKCDEVSFSSRLEADFSFLSLWRGDSGPKPP